MQKILLKRGDTLIWSCALADQSGVAVDLTNWVIESQVRDGDTLIGELTIVPTSLPNGQFNLQSGSTSAWPVRNLFCDIQYTTPDGIVTSSETFIVSMVKDVTVPVPVTP